MYFSFGIFMALLDIALNIYERVIEVKLLISYSNCEDTAWMWLTVGFILLPGIITAIAVAMKAIKERQWGGAVAAPVFLLFPISSLIW